MTENRRFKRLPFDAAACIEFLYQDEVLSDPLKAALSNPNRLIPLTKGKSIQVTGEVLDLSIKGALVLPEFELPIDTGRKVLLEIQLNGTDLSLEFEAELVHKGQKRLGFQFIRTDPESMMHLRRFLELNLGSDELVAREISILADGK